MAPDSSAIENAIVAKLLADGTLMALVPDGVYFDEAAPDSKRFVIVSLVDHVDVGVFSQGRAIEDALYLVKAVMQSKAGGNVQAAAKRIDDLLEDQPLTVAGFTWGATYREARIRLTEVDPADATIRWQHRGGHYRVEMTVG